MNNKTNASTGCKKTKMYLLDYIMPRLYGTHAGKYHLIFLSCSYSFIWEKELAMKQQYAASVIS